MGNITSKLRNQRPEEERKSASRAQTTLKEREQTTNPSAKPVFLHPSNVTSLPSSTFPTPAKGQVSWKTLLSSPLTPSNSLTAGVATCPPRTGFLAQHRHEQAELYFILEGEGLMKVDDVEERVEKGAVVFVPGNAEHGIRNLSEGEELVWVYCFAADSFGDVVYRFTENGG